MALAVSGGGCLHTPPGRLADATPANIEVDRPENNGAVNILPCTLVFGDGQKCILSGGDHAVMTVRCGTLWVAASSPNPYPYSDCPAVWRSPRFRLHVGPGETIHLSVDPKSKGSYYSGGWTIKRAATDVPDSCNQAWTPFLSCEQSRAFVSPQPNAARF
jgi:hypothetical protein